jgi:hypothetical protein
MQSITRFIEVRLRLLVNRQKSRAARLLDCTFLGFQIRRGKVVWTEKALERFKERVKEITGRSRGVSSFCMLRESLSSFASVELNPPKDQGAGRV